MTPEELRAARIAEAVRRHNSSKYYAKNGYDHLAELYETNWTPPEVDPDEKAARLYARQTPSTPEVYKLLVRAYLAGCTRGREGTKELVEALEWLDKVVLDQVCKNVIYAALASAKRGG